MPKPIRQFPYILVDEDGDMYGIETSEQAELYAQNDANSVYDVATGTRFGDTAGLPGAEELSSNDYDDSEDEDEDEED